MFLSASTPLGPNPHHREACPRSIAPCRPSLVDKPNLPFPDVSERTEEASEEDLKNWESLTETERAVAQKWADLVRGLDPKTTRQDQSVFDLGGHSLLAQQLLLMTRKEFGVDISINMLYEFPTLSGFSDQIEKVKGGASVDVLKSRRATRIRQILRRAR